MQKNCDLDYTLKSRKSVFGQLFFSLFSTLIFFGFYVFFQFFFMYFITSKIIFSKFGMYLTYKNRFWGHFSWFLGRGINSAVWTRIGSKIKKRVMVFKGLRGFVLKKFRKAPRNFWPFGIDCSALSEQTPVLWNNTCIVWHQYVMRAHAKAWGSGTEYYYPRTFLDRSSEKSFLCFSRIF